MNQIRLFTTIFIFCFLTACGGGGGSSNSDGDNDNDSENSDIIRTAEQNAPRFTGTWLGTMVEFEPGSRCEWQITIQFDTDRYEQQQADYFSGTASATIVNQSHEDSLFDSCLEFGEIPIEWSIIGFRLDTDNPWTYRLFMDGWDGDYSDRYPESFGEDIIYPDAMFFSILDTTDENRFENMRLNARNHILNFERQ